jgi:hypothetical protein
MKIWGRNLQTGVVECLDTFPKSEIRAMLREYRLAFGRGWVIWAGLKRDEPK